MIACLHLFIGQLDGTVAAVFLLVMTIAFLSIPYTLGGRPGEPRAVDAAQILHMS